MGKGIQLLVGVLQVGLHLFAFSGFTSRRLVKLRAIDQHCQLAPDTGKQGDFIRRELPDVPPAKHERADCVPSVTSGTPATV